MTNEETAVWLRSRLPADWFTGPAEVATDADEIVVIGTLPEPELAAGPGFDGAEPVGSAARASAAQRFRDESRPARVRIAQEVEQRFGRRLSWVVLVGHERFPFTTLSLPVMTRLRLPERQVLDTLVAAGVARSRSDALAWCVRLVGRHEADWIAELREALVKVGELRRKGPR
ncbi:MAG: hypothetical protein M3024_01875 [Candidatus Dormibacteraeota bacterium]|nr:hypothetical protein [Candidatus Dormibacteraeota bacterium]